MKLEQARVDFSNLQKRISAFKHATSLIYLDGETTAPPGTLENRSQSLSVLNEEIIRLSIGPETMDLLHYLEDNKYELTVNERRAVEYMLRDYNRRKNIPVDEYVRYENLLAAAQDAWHGAREDDNFDAVAPYLEQIFDVSRHFALLDNPDADPYQYWLSNYEEGLEVATCDMIFDRAREALPPLVQEIVESGVEIEEIHGDFSAQSQEALAFYLMELLGVDMDRVGFATADHPFTTQLGSHFDERIITKFVRTDFTSSLYSMLHGIGHILCDIGQADNLAYTALDGIASMVILESQGYFYENIIGKSRTFIEYIYPELCELFPDYTKDHSVEDIYRSVNKAKPGLIRIDADQLTFPLHTLVRYELEKALIRKDLLVKDLPGAWKELYKKYLNVDVPNYRDGVLQDIHWPFGAIGYFPTYVIGNAYGFGIARKMDETLDIEECVAKGDFKPMNEWNREKIWKHGGIYTSGELMSKFVKVSIDGEEHIEYLKERYRGVYNL